MGKVKSGRKGEAAGGEAPAPSGAKAKLLEKLAKLSDVVTAQVRVMMLF